MTSKSVNLIQINQIEPLSAFHSKPQHRTISLVLLTSLGHKEKFLALKVYLQMENERRYIFNDFYFTSMSG